MSKEKDKSIGGLIRHYRDLKGLTQDDLAEKLNLSYQQVQKYEYNKTTPSLNKVIQISKILEIPIDLFFNENLRVDLIHKIETEIEKNYELVQILKENPELQEVIKLYSRHKLNLKEINFTNFMKDMLNIPKDKQDVFFNTINKIIFLIK